MLILIIGMKTALNLESDDKSTLLILMIYWENINGNFAKFVASFSSFFFIFIACNILLCM